MPVDLSRRGFLSGIGALATATIGAPAIVRPQSLMRLAPLLVPGSITEYYDGEIRRLDVLYGYHHVRPEWVAMVEEPRFQAEHPDFQRQLGLDEFAGMILEPKLNKVAEIIARAVFEQKAGGLGELLGHNGPIPTMHVLTSPHTRG